MLWRWNVDAGALGITATHGFATYMLPLRLGELVLPVLVRRAGHARFGEALAGLVVVRIFDAMLVGMLGVGVYLAGPEMISMIWPGAETMLTSTVRGIAILMLAVSVVVALILLQALPGVHGLTARAGFIITSLGIWVSISGMNYFVMKAVGLQPEMYVLALLLVLGVFATLVPMQGVAGLGGHEIVWVASLMAGGLAADSALDIAIAPHVVLVVYSCVLGLIGFFLMGRSGR